jgi:hypothetical protein
LNFEGNQSECTVGRAMKWHKKNGGLAKQKGKKLKRKYRHTGGVVVARAGLGTWDESCPQAVRWVLPLVDLGVDGMNAVCRPTAEIRPSFGVVGFICYGALRSVRRGSCHRNLSKVAFQVRSSLNAAGFDPRR